MDKLQVWGEEKGEIMDLGGVQVYIGCWKASKQVYVDQFVNFCKFMLALIVLSSITKKWEIVKKMASLSHCFVILVIV